MNSLSIVTWNVNSVRSRIQRITHFVRKNNTDILCMQEIKCTSEQFPANHFIDCGMPYLNIVGQKGLHGVAIASRLPCQITTPPHLCRYSHARAAAIRIANTEIHNLYVPAGGDVPDPLINDKFAHKLDFVARMENHYRNRDNQPLILLGDLNIAPEPADVWSHTQLLKVVSHTPVETNAIKKVIRSGGFCDIARKTCPSDTKLSTWWSYRARDWQASDRGRRLDHIWANQTALKHVETNSFHIHRNERGGHKPSDHVPVSLRIRI